jgi:hypothetical protein
MTVVSRHSNNIVGPEPHLFADGKKRTASQYVEAEILYRSIVMETFESARNSTQKMDISKLRVAALKTLVLEAKIQGVRCISNDLCRRIAMTMFLLKRYKFRLLFGIYGALNLYHLRLLLRG